MKKAHTAKIKGLTITIDKIYCLPDAGDLKAFFDILVNDIIRIRGFRLLQAEGGLRISTPMEQGMNGKWYDQVLFTDAEFQCDFEKFAIAEYKLRGGK